jgi:hypothetical protein
MNSYDDPIGRILTTEAFNAFVNVLHEEALSENAARDRRHARWLERQYRNWPEERKQRRRAQVARARMKLNSPESRMAQSSHSLGSTPQCEQEGRTPSTPQILASDGRHENQA